jgi:D-3-phosphoglycerate dehydrogenase
MRSPRRSRLDVSAAPRLTSSRRSLQSAANPSIRRSRGWRTSFSRRISATEEAQERIGAEGARKLVEYSDAGTTMGAVNFPQVQIPVRARGTRYLQIHRNVPGTLGRVVEVFSRRSLNIAAQYLQTDGEIGYVVIDADTPMDDSAAVLEELRALDGAVRARLLYERR